MLKKRKLNNKGAALVSVLVVTAFITIIATTLLYMSAQNYQMKQTDYQNKQSFYGAERAVDELKNVLIDDVQEAYKAAYEDTAKNFLKLGDAVSRKEHYQAAYIDKLQEIWDTRLAAAVGADNAEKNVYMVRELMKSAGLSDEIANCIYQVDGFGISDTSTTGVGPSGATVTTTKKQFVIRGVRSKFTSGNYTTFIYTDIGLALPDIDLSVDASQTYAGTAKPRETIALTDYVIYMNWHKADYDE